MAGIALDLPLTLAFPLSWGFRALVGLRRFAYQVRLARAERAGAPVISIGNLTVGGTGKTPAALWLASALRVHGLRPAIVTRGYGGNLGGRVATVGSEGRALLEPSEVGDEAVLLAERFQGPVVCGANRVIAARTAVAEHGANVIVLDDGFQHWRLARELDIVLIDGTFGFGNRALLPAGPLREPARALRRAGAIIVTKAARGSAIGDLLSRYASAPGVFSAELVARSLVQFEGDRMLEQSLGTLAGCRVVTVSAIARPESFYELLGQWDVRPIEVLEFPDHHPYTPADWKRINQAARQADLVICTEKDLVKLRRFPFARGRLGALRVDFTLNPPDEAALLELVLDRIGASDGTVAEIAPDGSTLDPATADQGALDQLQPRAQRAT